ncbi:MAG: hypothetical protein WA208_03140, partial [Thermoanaerobaculia bacterium]
ALVAVPTPAIDRVMAALPLLNMTARGRFRFVIVFALIVLAAIGLDELRRSRVSRLVAGALAAALGVAVVLLVVASPFHGTYPGATAYLWLSELMPLISVAAFIALAAGAMRLLPLLPLLIFLDLAGIMWLYNPAVDRRFFFAATPPIGFVCENAVTMQRVTGIGAALLPNSATMFGLEDIRPHDPVSFRAYVRFLEAFGYDSRSYPGLFAVEPPRQLLDFLGVRHVFAVPGLRRSVLPPVYRDDHAVILRNPSALPRYFVPEEVRSAADPIDAFRRAGSARVAFVSSGGATPARADITVTDYGRNGTKLRVRAAAASFVASSDVALPGYRLFRGGREWPLTVVNGAFIGWSVPPGVSDFELRYVPEGLGLAIVLAGLAALGIMLAMHRRFWP